MLTAAWHDNLPILKVSSLGRFIDFTAFPLPNRNHDHQNFRFPNLIDEPIANAAQFDLVPVRASRELCGGHARIFTAFRELLLELLTRVPIELVPFFQSGIHESELIGHPD